MSNHKPYVSVFLQSKLFEDSGEAEIAYLLSHSETISLAPGQTLFQQGDAAESLYLVADGTLDVAYRPQPNMEETVIDQLGSGDIVGEMALIAHSIRTASVRARSSATLLEVKKGTFLNHRESYPHTFAQLTALFDLRLQREQLADTLHHIFPSLDLSLVDELQERLTWQLLRGGDVLFREGERGSSIFFVVNGRLRITRTQPDGSERFLTEVQRGDVVGEFALFTNEPRSATIMAVRDSQVVKLTKTDFEALVGQHPHALMAMTRLIVRRVQASNKNPEAAHRNNAHTIAFLPLHPSLKKAQIVDTLTKSFAALGKSMRLDRAIFSDQSGFANGADISEASPFNSLLLAWLSNLERQHNFVLYEADPTLSEWTRRCLHQADRVVLLADASAPPDPTPLEQELASMSIFARRELLLVHPETADEPQNTARWLAPRQIHAHYHIKIGERAHFDRAARRMAGCAIGVVYSGGGARGFAHLGVWRALEELEIPVDYIAGTSMGSILAATNAIGWDFSTISELARSLSNPRTLFDYTLPFTSLMASAKLTRFCKKLFGDRQIEDLWIPYFCIATNATLAEVDIIQSGPLWQAVRKSIAIPGVFTPVMAEGNVIIDGGIMNNFPIDVMQQLSESETVIGVNVSPYKEKKRSYAFDTSISGWAILWSRLNPFSKPLHAPSLVGTILRSLELNSVNLSKRQAVGQGVLIEPDVKVIGVLDFARFETAVEIGYSSALQPLKTWWACCHIGDAKQL